MIDIQTKSELMTRLAAGCSAEEIAKDFSDTLNAAVAEHEATLAHQNFNEEMESLVDEINVFLAMYCDLYKIQRNDNDIFTVDDIIEAFEAKIQGKQWCYTSVPQDEEPQGKAAQDMPKTRIVDGESIDDWDKAIQFLNTLFHK